MKELPDFNKPETCRQYLKSFAIQKFGEEKAAPITEYQCGGRLFKVDEMTDGRVVVAAHQMFRSLDWRAIDATIH
jgi:hypothetical protein